jgi:serine/threonine protein kinase
VHGDLKGVCILQSFEIEHTDACPQDNVLVAADGTLKLTDFGLAVMHDSVMQFSETDPGGGTTRWMVCLVYIKNIYSSILTYIFQAPELYRETGERCLETDVYALGMVSDSVAFRSAMDALHNNSCLRLCWQVNSVLLI